MPSDSSDSNNSTKRRQKAAERTGINLLRYVLDHPHATSRAIATDLGMSFPNVCRLVSEFKGSGTLVSGASKQTGRRGPRSQAVMMRPDLGCSIGVDLEATRVRGVKLDFAGEVVNVVRKPIAPSAGPEEVVSSVADVAGVLTKSAREKSPNVCALGLALPGPLVDAEMGRVRTELQFGVADIEFVPAVRGACGMEVGAFANIYCFAAGHHRIYSPREKGVEMVILDRFGLAAAVVWNGRLYTGATHYAGDLGLLRCGEGYPGRTYRDVCTGASLLRLARQRDVDKSFQELLQSPNEPVVREWLRDAVPAFAQAIFAAVIAYNPDRVVIEGIFNRFPPKIRRQIIRAVNEELAEIGSTPPSIRFFEGDDLMGARGAALLARDAVADSVLAEIVRS
ncbi:MAG: ROK family protein [Armatimonadetes bacterium]|nr:ROK family protein [Armatimonadota bacterium]